MATPTIYKKLEVDPDLAQGPRARYKLKGKGVTVPDAVAGQNGRGYHRLSPGTYYLPNDVAEQNRLDLQHQMCKLILDGKLGLAPVPPPNHVLDVATGTGVWAIEYAKNNPQAQVIGTDLSAMQSRTTVPNVSFVQQDVEKEEWNYPRPFDYIHLRYILSCFNDAKSVFRKAHSALRPGGYIEIFDLVFHPRYNGDKRGPALDQWCAAIYEAAKTQGRDFRKAERYKDWLEEIGFVDVVDVEFKCSGNAWPKDDKMKEIGAHQAEAKTGALLSLGSYFGATAMSDMVHSLAPQAVREMDDLSIRLWWPMHIVYGRKALHSDSA